MPETLSIVLLGFNGAFAAVNGAFAVDFWREGRKGPAAFNAFCALVCAASVLFTLSRLP